MKEIQQLINNYTVQLCLDKNSDGSEISPLASGVLVRYANDYYLLTAGHVLTEDITKIVIIIDDTAYRPMGNCSYIYKESSCIENLVDIAFFNLDGECVNDLSQKYSFLDIDKADQKITEKVVIYGYPVSKTRKEVTVENEIHRFPFIFHTQYVVDEGKIRRLGLNYKFNCMVDYHYKKLKNLSNNRRYMSPKPEGLSGCGLWGIHNGKVSLQAIMTSYNHKESVFWGIKIDEILNIIDSHKKKEYDLSKL